MIDHKCNVESVPLAAKGPLDRTLKYAIWQATKQANTL
jgi:hypothetical protein